MATHRQLGVAEDDVGVDHAVDDEPGDREDVEWPSPWTKVFPGGTFVVCTT
jgi:hypothetical protein